jgi:uncharacterized protein (TIGR03083 family)
MTNVRIDIDAVTRITSAGEAQRIGLAANEALLADLRTLTPEQWDTPTVCAPWTITDMVRHLVGATKANASTREMLRQQIYGARHKSAFGGNPLDATNDLQVRDHRDLGAEQLVVELEARYPKSVRNRTGKSRIYNRVSIPIDAGGSTATGMPRRLNLGELFRVVYTRDVWLHRIDIARALGREPELEPTIDGRIIEDVVKEWADRHGEPFDLRLTGAAGGDFRRTGPGPVIELDAVDFCWILSGRGQIEAAAPGATLLAHRVLF